MMGYLSRMFYNTGGLAVLTLQLFKSARHIRRHISDIIYHIYDISANSMLVMILGAFFLGMVASYQIAYQMRDYIPMVYLSALMTQSVILELGPLMTGIAFAGRVTSSTAAEITSMKTTDQIDAIRVMSIDPVEYLVLPRITAAVLIIPFLTVIVEFVIILGAFIIAVAGLDIPANVFLEGTRKNFEIIHVFGGMLKSVFFGFFTVLIPCYFAFNAGHGSKAVGDTTTKSVIISVICVIIVDYILTRVIFVW
ncbi:MAG: ABC transporter permease [candidate division WOR-3 bacterium]|nr:ABC transporter permease [candidate division WOR-3 bacterium]